MSYRETRQMLPMLKQDRILTLFDTISALTCQQCAQTLGISYQYADELLYRLRLRELLVRAKAMHYPSGQQTGRRGYLFTRTLKAHRVQSSGNSEHPPEGPM